MKKIIQCQKIMAKYWANIKINFDGNIDAQHTSKIVIGKNFISFIGNGNNNGKRAIEIMEGTNPTNNKFISLDRDDNLSRKNINYHNL